MPQRDSAFNRGITMTVISGGKKAIVKKMSPNGQLVLAWRPKPYPKTPQQKKVGEAARACGIHKGISKDALRKAMIECIPGKFGR